MLKSHTQNTSDHLRRRRAVLRAHVLNYCNRQVDLMEESEEEAEKPLTRTCAAIPNAAAEADVRGAKVVP